MPFSAEIMNQYKQLIQKKLNLHIKTEEDFDLIIVALRKIVNGQFQLKDLPEPSSYRKALVKSLEFFNFTGRYVSDKNDYPEFQALAAQCINHKIKQFKQMEAEDKRLYIARRLFERKIKADYIEMVNDLLDKIPLSTVEDYAATIQQLNSLLVLSHIDTHQIAEPIKAIAEVLADPDMYVPVDQIPSFVRLIKKRIIAKIKAFEAMSLPEKIKYIDAQKTLKSESQASSERAHELGEAHRATRLISHTTGVAETEEEWLLRMQQEFQQTGNIPLLDNVAYSQDIIAIERASEGQFIARLMGMDPALGVKLIENSENILDLLNNTFLTLDELLDMDNDRRNMLLDNTDQCFQLIRVGIPLERLLEIEYETSSHLIDKIDEVTALLEAGLSFDELMSSRNICFSFMENSENVIRLFRSGITFQQLNQMTLEQRKQFLNASKEIESFIKAGITPVDLCGISFELQTEMFEHPHSVLRLLKAHIPILKLSSEMSFIWIENEYELLKLLSFIPLIELIAMKPSLLERFIDDHDKVIRLLKVGFTINELSKVSSKEWINDYIAVNSLLDAGLSEKHLTHLSSTLRHKCIEDAFSVKELLRKGYTDLFLLPEPVCIQAISHREEIIKLKKSLDMTLKELSEMDPFLASDFIEEAFNYAQLAEDYDLSKEQLIKLNATQRNILLSTESDPIEFLGVIEALKSHRKLKR